eukprot:387588-Pelagomonas_calceolata.AAC.1
MCASFWHFEATVRQCATRLYLAAGVKSDCVYCILRAERKFGKAAHMEAWPLLCRGSMTSGNVHLRAFTHDITHPFHHCNEFRVWGFRVEVQSHPYNHCHGLGSCLGCLRLAEVCITMSTIN